MVEAAGRGAQLGPGGEVAGPWASPHSQPRVALEAKSGPLTKF